MKNNFFLLKFTKIVKSLTNITLNFLVKKRNVISISIIILLILAVVFLMALFISCKLVENIKFGKDDNKSLLDTSTPVINNSETDDGVLLIGSDTTYPPFAFIKDEKPDGFDIDIAKEIAKRMEREFEIVPISWESIYEDVNEGKLDMIISAIPISTEKEKVVDFSDPYFVMEYLLLCLSGTDIKIKEDLEGRVVGVLKSEKENLGEEYLANYEVAAYDDVVVMLEELKNKKIEGILISIPMSINILRENKEMYVILDRVKSNKEFGIVFSEGSRLKEEVNKILEEIKEDGTYSKIYDRWFGF